MAWVGEATQVVSTLFAAVATGAAWASVRQGQRVWRASVEPDIHLQVLKNANTNTTDLVVFNVGGGIAKGVGYLLAAGGHRVHGFLGDGFVNPGDKVAVATTLGIDDKAEALVLYRTGDESSWAVTRDGRKKRLRKGREGGSFTGQEAWNELMPGVAFGHLPFGRAHVRWIEKGGALVPPS